MLKGNITDGELTKIKDYLINSVDSRESVLTKPETLEDNSTPPEDVEIIKGFIQKSTEELKSFIEKTSWQ